jgi:hypothetical protein
MNEAKWIKGAALVLCIIGGLVLALGAHPATALIADIFVDLAFWPLDGAQSVDTPAARFISALAGGAFVSMGVLLWRTTQMLSSAPAYAVQTIIAGVLAWFAVDSAFSIVAGAWFNAILNAGLALILLWPLLRKTGTAQSPQ